MFGNVAANMAGGIAAIAEMTCESRAGRHQASVAEYTVMPSFFFMDKILFDL
jgi:hypothetical protein